MTNELIVNSILTEVGEGRLTTQEAEQELREANIPFPGGIRKSLLAFEATAILTGAGYDRNGF